MPLYRAYGLCIRSALALPELIQLDGDFAIDVDIRFGAVGGPLPGPDVPRIVRLEQDRAFLAWSRIGRFAVTRDGEVTVDVLTDQSLALRFALLGPVMAAYFQLNGVALLHGSAVAIDGRAILCIGRKAAGKSTMAAALVAAGCDLLNDDVLPLRIGTFPAITPGFPALKLSRQARTLLLPDARIVGDESPDQAEKILIRLPEVHLRNVDIGLVVVLDPEAPVGITTIPSTVALSALLQEGYCLKFGDHAFEAGQGRVLFDACARIAGQCCVVRAGRVPDLADLPALASELYVLAKN